MFITFLSTILLTNDHKHTYTHTSLIIGENIARLRSTLLMTPAYTAINPIAPMSPRPCRRPHRGRDTLTLPSIICASPTSLSSASCLLSSTTSYSLITLSFLSCLHHFDISYYRLCLPNLIVMNLNMLWFPLCLRHPDHA